ncbi:DUF4374 domain-containing protein [Prevotella sp. MA2016]|uniref:DUF4374 domain-containing protein n=1 Tax=Prevotella sp. MA2016 TaxID=1408310 RepID=UPI00048D17AA|nr:DUF4374 domain-containing protein [Prevotella sp. MA2016]
MKNCFRNSIILAAMAVGVLTACEDDLAAEQETPNAPYILSLGVTSNGNTTYYVVSTDNLMEGTINAVGKGIEQNGYHDYQQGSNSIFCIGGLGLTNATAVVRGADGLLKEQGEFVFDNSLSGFCQVDDRTMVGLELPVNKESGSQLTFYTVDAQSAAILDKNASTTVDPIDRLDWPSVTGMMYSGGNLYVTYTPMNSLTFETAYTDTCFVAVYSYPDMKFVELMKDTRMGPGGSWGAYNGLMKDEQDNLYVMSNSALSNGYSQSTKHAGFLRIKKGATTFDADYFFDFEAATGGLKPAHVAYVGNGLVFAEVSTLNPQTANDRWGDKSLKCCIIDLVNQTVTDIDGIPVHNGNGGRRFAYLHEGGYVYLPVSTPDGVYIYRTDIATARAERGARVSTSFVGGFFRL